MSVKLPKITLIRGSTQCILHGTVHVGTTEMYSYFKKETDVAIHSGTIFFYEGIDNGDDLDPKPSYEEYQIADAVAFLLDQIVVIADRYESLEETSEMARFQDCGIVADATFQQLVRKLYEVGWHCTQHFRSVQQEMEDEKSRLEKEPSYLGATSPDDAWEKLPFMSKLFMTLYGTVLHCIEYRFNRIFVDWRNEVAVKIIEETISTSSASKVLIHYGVDHIKGIQKLLVRHGWSVTKTETIFF